MGFPVRAIRGGHRRRSRASPHVGSDREPGTLWHLGGRTSGCVGTYRPWRSSRSARARHSGRWEHLGTRRPAACCCWHRSGYLIAMGIARVASWTSAGGRPVALALCGLLPALQILRLGAEPHTLVNRPAGGMLGAFALAPTGPADLIADRARVRLLILSNRRHPTSTRWELAPQDPVRLAQAIELGRTIVATGPAADRLSLSGLTGETRSVRRADPERGAGVNGFAGAGWRRGDSWCFRRTACGSQSSGGARCRTARGDAAAPRRIRVARTSDPGTRRTWSQPRLASTSPARTWLLTSRRRWIRVRGSGWSPILPVRGLNSAPGNWRRWMAGPSWSHGRR